MRTSIVNNDNNNNNNNRKRIIMFVRCVGCLLLVTLIRQTFTCPIPFNIQSKCRCAITEAGRVYIYCARKQLTVIPHFNTSNIIFDELVLSGNRISIVHKNAFNGLKLRKLELQANPIDSIENQAFIDLANYLEEFILSTTVISSQLTSNTFMQILTELPNLKRLALRGFDLSTLLNLTNTNGLVLRKLTQLSLQSCSIVKIDDVDTFIQTFPNLERLDLSENRFDYFHLPLVSGLKKLKVLILSKNRIRHLNIHPSFASNFVQPSSSLTELDLSYNGIETINENLFDLLAGQLEILNLRNNELTTEKQLSFLINLNHLHEFYLDYNRLESINQLTFPLNLRHLSLKNNRLTYVDLSALTRLEYLEKLFLSSNKLTKLSSTIKNVFASLETLELDRNHLSFISSLNAPKLKQLNLDGNFLGRKLDKKIFSNLPQLERLHLRDNQIELMDNQSFQNTRLQSLDLRNNSLKMFPTLVKLNESLQSLSLRRNQICTIDQDALDFFVNLLTLELDQNPLHCDCRMGKDFKQTKVTGQCESPPERRSAHLNELPHEPLACSLLTVAQCSHLTRTISDFEKEVPVSTSSPAMKIVDKIVNDAPEEPTRPTATAVDGSPFEIIRIADLTIAPLPDRSHLLVQWHFYPSTIDVSSNDAFRRSYFNLHDIHGFKISSNSPVYQMSDVLDVLQRNYTLDYMEQGEICLYLLRKVNYEKFCKQVSLTSTEASKSSLLIDSKPSQLWYTIEPTKSILIGSMLGIVFVLVLLACVIAIATRCPYLLFCRLRSSKYHQSNDSKSESLLVRPTPTNTIPWQSQQPQAHFYPPPPPPLHHHPHHHHHQLRPVSYQASVSTQCTCPTHYHSSGSSSIGTNSTGPPHGHNYHIYQEISNEDCHSQNICYNYRTYRPKKIETTSPPTSLSTNATMNSEQCQLCSLSVLV